MSDSSGDDADSDTTSHPTLSTGLESLDSQLDGNGLNAGTIATVEAPPNSSSEHLLYNLTASRDTHYFSCLRNPDQIEDLITAINPETTVHIEFFHDAPGTDALRDALESADIEDGSTVVVDPTNFMESDNMQNYRDFLQTFRSVVTDTNSLGLLHALEQPDAPDHRWLTLAMSDVIFKVQHREDHQDVQDHLLVPKMYGEQNIDRRTFKLPDDSLEVDVGTKSAVQA